MHLPRLLVIGIAVAASPALAATPHAKKLDIEKKVEVAPPSPADGTAAIGATPETRAILSDCSAMKFETTVEIGSGADARRTHVKMCSKPGETKEHWIASLSEAATKIGGNLDLAPDSRDRLVAAIQAEIARLKS